METARQILRWGIPGWLFFIFLGLFLLVGYEVDKGFPTIAEVLGDRDVKDYMGLIPGISLVGGFLGIPLGFLIYQFYVWAYWRGLTFWRVTPEDRGYCIFCGLNLGSYLKTRYGREPIPKKDDKWSLSKRLTALLASRTRWAVWDFLFFLRTTKQANQLRWNWFLAEAAWLDLTRQDSFHRLNTHVEQLGALFHSLGAGRVSAIAAFLLYFAYSIFNHSSKVIWLPIGVPTKGPHPVLYVFVLAFCFVFVFSTARFYVLRDVLSAMKNAFIVNIKEAHLSVDKPADAPCEREPCHLGHWS